MKQKRHSLKTMPIVSTITPVIKSNTYLGKRARLDSGESLSADDNENDFAQMYGGLEPDPKRSTPKVTTSNIFFAGPSPKRTFSRKLKFNENGTQGHDFRQSLAIPFSNFLLQKSDLANASMPTKLVHEERNDF
jgi:hypothetical protein